MTVYKHLKLVEYTSLPLSVAILLYIISGYGTISQVPSVIGFNYVTSVKAHTLPLLRYLTTLLVAAHVYAGNVLIINRSLRNNPRLKGLLTYLNVLYATLLIAVATLSEIDLLLPP